MPSPSRFFTFPHETEHILLLSRACLGSPELPTVSLELISLAQFALNQRQNIFLFVQENWQPKGLCNSLEGLWSPNPL